MELLCAGAFVQCRVLDNGAAPANVQRGSGLKIVRELIKALDGRFEQKFGTAGSTSILTFPYSIVRRWTVSCSAPAWGALEPVDIKGIPSTPPPPNWGAAQRHSARTDFERTRQLRRARGGSRGARGRFGLGLPERSGVVASEHLPHIQV